MALMIRDELEIEDFDERNLKCCCPFHNEDHVSFIWNPKSLSFHCFGSCGRSYDIIDIYMHKGLTYLEACDKLFQTAKIPYTFGERKVRTKRAYRYPKEVICTDKTQVYHYLSLRKISPETADYLDIRQDEEGNCVFNYYDANDTLTMVKYRPSHRIEKGQSKNWCQENADTAPILFNMNRINPDQPLLICSGELDCAAAVEAGWKNAVSIPLGDQNLHWVQECYDWLEQFQSIIICPDNDESGTKYQKTVVPMLGAWRTKTIHLPTTVINKRGEEQPLKDLNELLYHSGKEAVIDAILSAEDSPVASVVDLSEIQATDYEDVDGVQFGLKPLDDNLLRLFFGTLTVISGRPGSGKSSLISQLVCNALDQGINTWLYSGELPNSVEKSWFNYIFAGPRNVEDSVSTRGDAYKRITNKTIAAINEKYKGRWYIYRDDGDNTLDSLLDSMTNSVRKYATKLLILDNFMCIDTENSDSELKAQTDTIKKLILFARRYDCAVILVAHPRKLSTKDGGAEIGLDDIAGTSNIANLAHRTISMRRVTDADRDNAARFSPRRRALLGCDVLVTILKDRMFGRSNIELGLYYDPASRRFFSDDEEYDHQYLWDTNLYDGCLSSGRNYDAEEVFGD